MNPGILRNTCILAVCLVVLRPAFSQGRARNAYVIKNVNVIPMDEERIIPGQTVIVEDGVITKIGSDVNPGSNAAIIDGREGGLCQAYPACMFIFFMCKVNMKTHVKPR